MEGRGAGKREGSPWWRQHPAAVCGLRPRPLERGALVGCRLLANSTHGGALTFSFSHRSPLTCICYSLFLKIIWWNNWIKKGAGPKLGGVTHTPSPCLQDPSPQKKDGLGITGKYWMRLPVRQ